MKRRDLFRAAAAVALGSVAAPALARQGKMLSISGEPIHIGDVDRAFALDERSWQGGTPREIDDAFRDIMRQLAPPGR
jgi:hypothetical protein